MAENDKCVFCGFGTILWIHMPAEITTDGKECHQLYCTDCGAHGVFVRKEKKKEKKTNRDENGYCLSCGYPGCMGGWVCPGAP